MEQISTVEFKNKLNPKGYVLINYNSEWILKHRLIMMLYLRRNLKPEEKVHHDNFFKQDNRIENLTLFPSTKRHSHFHRQIKQFGYTQPRRTEIKILKQVMEFERNKLEVKDEL